MRRKGWVVKNIDKRELQHGKTMLIYIQSDGFSGISGCLALILARLPARLPLEQSLRDLTGECGECVYSSTKIQASFPFHLRFELLASSAAARLWQLRQRGHWAASACEFDCVITSTTGPYRAIERSTPMTSMRSSYSSSCTLLARLRSVDR
jgi:hypothetical protein